MVRSKVARLSVLIWHGLLVASPFVFLALAGYRAWRVESTIGAYSGCHGCFWLATLGQDAWLLAAMLALIGIGCMAPWRWLRSVTRISGALVLLVFAGDIATDTLLSQRLYVADVIRFAGHLGDDLSVLRAGMDSAAGIGQGILGLAIVAVVLGIAFPSDRRPRTGAVCLAAALSCAGFATVEAAHPVRYMNILSTDNVVEANLPQGRTVEFSKAFIAQQRKLAEGLPRSCSTSKAAVGSVVILMVESLSAWQSRLLDGTHDWTPQLDAIALENHYFRNFYANGFTTSTGAIALITGRVPFVPAGKTWFDFSDYADPTGSLPDIAHRSGREAAFFTTEDVSFLNLGDWLNRLGFDVVDSSTDPFYRGRRHAQFGGAEDAVLYARFLEWMDARTSSRPFISVLSTISSHPPFVDPRTSRIDPKGSFTYVDEQIARFYEALQQRGFFKSGLLLVLGDHRTMTPLHADEYNRYHDRAFARIPMIVAGAVDMPAVIDETFQQADIPASIAYWVGLRACEGAFSGIFLRREPQPAQYLVHMRGDDRNRIDVYSGGSRTDGFRLDGDRSSWIDGRPADANMTAAWIDWQREQARSDR